MARQPNDAPETFARLIARAIRREIGDRRMSDAALARWLGKSNKYVAARLDETFEFSLNDIESFCQHIEVKPENWVGSIVSDRDHDLAARPTITAPGLTWVPSGDGIGTPVRHIYVRPDEDTSGIDELTVLTAEELAQRDLDLAALRDKKGTPDGNDARTRT